MPSLKGMLLILLLSLVLAEQIVLSHLIFLNKLIQRIEEELRIETLVIFQHHQDMNCILQDWNPAKPTLRVNERTQIVVRKNFNTVGLALVCISDDFGIELLNVVAMVYEDIRYERIVLLTKRKPSKEFLDKVAKQATEHKFVHLIVLEMGDEPSGYLSMHRLNPFPFSYFAHIDNFLSVQQEIFHVKVNFQGMTAIVKTSENSLQKAVYDPKGVIPLYRIEDMEVFEFARQTNLSLKFLEGNQSEAEHFDIELNMRFITQNNSVAHLGYINPFSSSSLIVVVPCGHEMSLKDIFNQLDFRTWLLYILYLYCTLVLVETFIVVVTLRIRGQPYGLTRMGSLANLRAFRALLGMSFPVSPRASLSLRQLCLAMSVFGMVFSSFFSCKLSALLTKHPYQAQVTNFEELRDSGLTVIVDPQVHSFLKSELGADTLHQLVPSAKSLPGVERFKLLISLNTSYAYIIFEENMKHLNRYQRSLIRRALCTSEELSIIDNAPRVYTLQKNSIFRWPLSRFVMWLQEAGITESWMRKLNYNVAKFFNSTHVNFAHPEVIPLSLDHLRWLGCLLILGYGAATLVFIAEVFLSKSRATYRGSETKV